MPIPLGRPTPPDSAVPADLADPPPLAQPTSPAASAAEPADPAAPPAEPSLRAAPTDPAEPTAPTQPGDLTRRTEFTAPADPAGSTGFAQLNSPVEPWSPVEGSPIEGSPIEGSPVEGSPVEPTTGGPSVLPARDFPINRRRATPRHGLREAEPAPAGEPAITPGPGVTPRAAQPIPTLVSRTSVPAPHPTPTAGTIPPTGSPSAGQWSAETRPADDLSAETGAKADPGQVRSTRAETGAAASDDPPNTSPDRPFSPAAPIGDASTFWLPGAALPRPAGPPPEPIGSPEPIAPPEQFAPPPGAVGTPTGEHPTIAVPRDRAGRPGPPEPASPWPTIEQAPWPAPAMRLGHGAGTQTAPAAPPRPVPEREPRNPATGLAIMVTLALLAAFFGWVSADPLWLALGHGERGQAIITQCSGSGIAQRCRGIVTTADFTTEEITILGVPAEQKAQGSTVPARIVDRTAPRAYTQQGGAGPHLRWTLGLALVFLCGLGIAWATGATRLKDRRSRTRALLLSLGGPLALTLGFLIAAW